MLRIKEARMARHVSQKDLAEVLGIGISSLSQYENGQRQPGYDTILRIADYFDVSTDYLLGRNTAGPTITADENRLLSYYRSFNDDGKGQIMDFAYRMKRSGLYEQGTDYFMKGFEMEDY